LIIKSDNIIKSDPLRITFLSHSSCKGKDEVNLYNLIKDLTSKNIKCHVILPKKGWLSEELIKLSVPFDIIDFPWWIYNLKGFHRSLWNDIINSSVKIAYLISKKLPDIIFTNTVYVAQGAIIANYYNIPHIWLISEHNETDENTIFLLDITDRTKFIQEYSEKILFTSESIQSFFHQFIDSHKSMLCLHDEFSDGSAIKGSDKIYDLMLTLKSNSALKIKLINILKEFIICFNNNIEICNHLVYEKDKTIANLLSSRSWRITAPLRMIDDFLRNRQLANTINSSLLQKVYDNIPLPNFLKRQIDNFIHHYVTDFAGWLSTIIKGTEAVKPIATFYDKLSNSADNIPEINFPETLTPTVSIIIPVYNNWRYTYACLQAIRERSGHLLPYEVIIADDGSTDDTTKMLARIHGVAIIKNEHNLGFLRNCNNAAQKARGKYLVFLNILSEVCLLLHIVVLLPVEIHPLYSPYLRLLRQTYWPFLLNA